MMHESLAVAGLAAGAFAWWLLRRTSPAAAAPMAITPAADALQRHEVVALAERTVSAYRLAAPVPMLVTMAWIESGWRPRAIGDDGDSLGLMQVSRRTGAWLAQEMGFSAFGTAPDLLRADVSMYLGAAYVSWLARYRGVAQSEEWIVRAYNGGQGWNLPADHDSWLGRNREQVLANTARHWGRYLAAKAALGFA